ncbi:MAG: histidine kinase N-terminal 7TM domain-containing protein [Ardenticatenaceae bacterium]
MQDITPELILSFLNLIVSVANLLLAFSLVVYILTHNLLSSVARTFATLMAFVSVVYGSDIILMSRDLSDGAITAWLKFQWLGIALVPAAYLHFSDALLRTTNASSPHRRVAVFSSYLIGLLFVLMAVFTNLIVGQEVHYKEWAAQLEAGPLFWLFAFFFFLASAWGFANTLWARSRALTPTSRRRMSYLVASFAAPGLAVYPYLLFASLPSLFSPLLLLLLLVLGNIGVALMITVMAYSVAYQGALAPDRVVKRSFLAYLLRGPNLGLFVLLLILVMPRVEMILGAPRETILIFAVVGGIIFYEVLLNYLRPLFDFWAYRDDSEEFEILRSIEERLVTSSDLHQLFENILTAVCDLQRARTGAVVSLSNKNGQSTLDSEVACGDKKKLDALLSHLVPSQLAISGDFMADQIESWHQQDTFRLLPLRAGEQGGVLGFLMVEPIDEAQPLTDRERQLMRQYVHQAEIGLQDRRLQQNIFSLLEKLTPQMETLQEWRSSMPFPNTVDPSDPESNLETATNPVHDENFKKWVKAALGHYWGGPRLTESPLLDLSIVRVKLAENDNNPARALRAVLTDALDALKPEGKREMATPEWLLYNILDLKYIQRRRARDVAMRLAMSESDLYRKQRAAFDELAKAISKMEQELQ